MDGSAEELAVNAPRWMDVYAKGSAKHGKKQPREEEAEPPEQETPPELEFPPEASATAQVFEQQHHYTPLAEQKPPQIRHILMAGIALVLALSGGALLFASKRSLRDVNLAGIPVHSSTNPAVLEEQVRTETAKYKVMVALPDGKTQSAPLSKTDIEVDAAASAATALQTQKPHNLLQRLQWWHDETVPLTLKVNDIKLEEFIEDFAVKTVTPTKNAKLSIKSGKLVTTPEKVGTAVTVDNAAEVFKAQVAELKERPIELTKQTLKPKITLDDLKEPKRKAQAILDSKVVLSINASVYRPTRAQIGKWIELTPQPADNTVDVTVNGGRVVKYIDSIAAWHIRPAVNEVVLENSDGSKRVLVPGQPGTDVKDKNKLAANIADRVAAGENITAKATVTTDKYKTINAKAYPRWFMVDLTKKRMYAYAKDKVVRVFLISAGGPQYPTVTGHYKIYRKVRIEDMEGDNADGSRYFQPDVEWVNYFHGAYAIHGNYWRPPSWFGNVNSSHGCVGIQNHDAKWVYEWAPVGTPVIVFN